MIKTTMKGTEIKVTTLTEQIKPYFIEELGCEGLSSQDIAISLGVPKFLIHQKMNRPDFKRLLEINGYRNIATAIKRVTQGRPEKLCYLETRAAKALVATHNSETGYKYLDFLFECERVALELVPLLTQQIKLLEQQNIMLRTSLEAKQKALPTSRKGSLAVPVYAEDMFGTVYVQKWELAHRDSMSEIDKLKAKLRHAIKVNHGLVKGIEELNERVLCLEEGKTRKVLKLIKE